LSQSEFEETISEFNREIQGVGTEDNDEAIQWFTERLCAEDRNESHVENFGAGGASAPYNGTLLRVIPDFCKDPTWENYEEVFKGMLMIRARTCKVWSMTDSETTVFNKVKPNKWISNSGPTGICNVVILRELEHDPDNKWQWTYKQTRTYVDEGNDLCAHIEVGKPRTFSWEGGPFKMGCEWIEFGM
jgi:hypothetical protein